jgi:hypothetical protein
MKTPRRREMIAVRPPRNFSVLWAQSLTTVSQPGALATRAPRVVSLPLTATMPAGEKRSLPERVVTTTLVGL